MEKLPITLTIITLNEEANIERCIRSVPFASEVVVVDSHSKDKTVEIAEGLGAKVVQQEWLGFEKQKQFAVDQSSNDWILSLDADEELSQELQIEIQTLLGGINSDIKRDGLSDAYKIPRLSWHFGRWIRHGGWYPDFQVRLFNKQKARWTGGGLHEHIEATDIGRLKNNMHHYVFRNLSHQVVTNDRYSTLGAEGLQEKGKKFSVLKLIFRPISKFLELYILKKGFMDGVPGFVIAVGGAYSMFLRYAKLYEMDRCQAPEIAENVSQLGISEKPTQ